MRLKLVSCVTAVLALCLMAMPAAAGGKYRHGCCGHAYSYTYAVPAYTYSPGYVYRPYSRRWRGYRVRTVPAYSYRYYTAPYTYPAYAYCP